MQQRSLFGTDGIRGEFTTDPTPGLMNVETVSLATLALAGQIDDSGRKKHIIIGRDTRESGAVLADAAIAGALMQPDTLVWDAGIAPTPAVQKAAAEMGASAVVITASHNPPEDNGWKGMIGSDKPTSRQTEELSRRFWRHVDSGVVIPRHLDKTRLTPIDSELQNWYLEKVLTDIRYCFGADKPLEGSLFVVDGAYGAAQSVTPDILRCLGANVEEFCCDGQGAINDGCGAANLSGLFNFLASRPDIVNSPRFVGALANDGDADRMMAMGVVRGESGAQLVEVNGNHTMWAHAQGEPGIVGTLYTNSGLTTALKQEGIGFEYCDNGDVYVTEALKRKREEGLMWRRGGEFTGHHVDLDWLSSGDGVRMAAWLAGYAATRNMTFGDLYQELPLWSEHMVKVRLNPGQNGKDIVASTGVQRMMSETTERLGDTIRFVVRPSGTEPVVRGWFECQNPADVDPTATAMESALQAAAANA